MRVAVLTFHWPENFGAAWQAYALSAALAKLGHDPLLIDYRPPDQLPAYKLPVGRFILTPKMVGFAKRKLAFGRFRRRHFPETSQLYRSGAELESAPPEADAYIAGSDQVWNPDLLDGEYDPSYFLRFASSGRRISYAASFGETRELLPTKELRDHLSRFDAISVRETEAARVLKDAFHMDIATVCDPVFLLDDYDPFLSIPPVKRDFLFVYNLFSRRSTDDLSMKLGRAMDCEVRRVNDDWKLWKYSSKAEYGISPTRWLSLIHSSRLILSDSFHATAFSLLLRKNFLTILANQNGKKTNRIVNLLRGLHLEDRIVSAADPTDVLIDKCRHPIDWNAVHCLIQDSRRDALQYLGDALDG